MSFNFAVDSVNEFGSNGGFDRFIQLLRDILDNKATLQMLQLQHVTDFLARTMTLWHK
jgi:hypothetical protein